MASSERGMALGTCGPVAGADGTQCRPDAPVRAAARAIEKYQVRPNLRARLNRYAARLSPLNAGQGFSPRSLLPIRPHVGTDDPTAGADHARAEGGNRNQIVERINIEQGASWWQSWHVTESERTPFSRMLASVIGGPR
jgi:hypothetical protein